MEFWEVSRLTLLLFLEAPLLLFPPSIYIPGTDSEAIEIGFGIAECLQTADTTLPKKSCQLGYGTKWCMLSWRGQLSPPIPVNSHLTAKCTRTKVFLLHSLDILWFGAQSTRVGFAIHSNRFQSSCPIRQVSSCWLGCLLFFFVVFFFFSLPLAPFFFFLIRLEFQFPEPLLPLIQASSKQDLTALLVQQ